MAGNSLTSYFHLKSKPTLPLALAISNSFSVWIYSDFLTFIFYVCMSCTYVISKYITKSNIYSILKLLVQCPLTIFPKVLTSFRILRIVGICKVGQLLYMDTFITSTTRQYFWTIKKVCNNIKGNNILYLKKRKNMS